MTGLLLDHDTVTAPAPKSSGRPDRFLSFLRDPRSYPDHPRAICLRQTHASWVVLTTRYAYKLKRPVNFGFLDFSTLEKRRHYCQREVLLNRRLCPGVYLGVVPISVRHGRLHFGPGGGIVEYAVKMRRLPERRSMLRCVEQGRVTTHDIDALVATLTAFYAESASTPDIAAWGSIRKLRISTDENFRQTADLVRGTITRPAFEAIRLFTDEFYRHHAALFAARVRTGRIRDCHGDLRLEHIHLPPPRLTIYDRIEFSDRLRYLDVASDTAFLAMDFDFHGRPDLARYFAGHIADALHDRGLLALLDFYQCYRAYVRGKVEGLRHDTVGIGETEQRESRSNAERYFRLALQYAIAGSTPMVLVVMGRVGSGKSTLARALGRELGWEVLSSDRLRKDLAAVPLHRRGPAPLRRQLYSNRMTDRTYAALTRNALELLRERRGVILDATFASRHRRDLLRKTIERAGAGCCFVETQAHARTVQRRLAARDRSTTEVSDARLEDWAALERRYEPPTELAAPHFLAVKTARRPEAVLAATLKTLARRHARATQPS
jgi:aminoglycoside phosphotransferase family enzyme/predicted kinase